MDTTWTVELEARLVDTGTTARLLGVSGYRARILEEQLLEMQPELVA